jgi:hypothetical protein
MTPDQTTDAQAGQGRIVILVNDYDSWGDKSEGWWRLADVEASDPVEALRERFADFGSKPRHGDMQTFIAATCGLGHPWQEWTIVRRYYSTTESIKPRPSDFGATP